MKVRVSDWQNIGSDFPTEFAEFACCFRFDKDCASSDRDREAIYN